MEPRAHSACQESPLQVESGEGVINPFPLLCPI